MLSYNLKCHMIIMAGAVFFPSFMRPFCLTLANSFGERLESEPTSGPHTRPWANPDA